MTVEQFKKDFESALYKALDTHRLRSPYKTGNLRYKGIQIMKTPNGYKIWVDLTVAPYALDLDSKQSIKNRYPEGWFDHICLKIIQELMMKYNKKEYEDTEKENFEDLDAIRSFAGANKAMRKHSSANYVLGPHTSIKDVKLNVAEHQVAQYNSTGKSYFGYQYLD